MPRWKWTSPAAPTFLEFRARSARGDFALTRHRRAPKIEPIMAFASLMRQNNRNNATPSADRAWGGEALV